jgi:hypothetical protein
MARCDETGTGCEFQTRHRKRGDTDSPKTNIGDGFGVGERKKVVVWALVSGQEGFEEERGENGRWESAGGENSGK